jgi:hypothetical protein
MSLRTSLIAELTKILSPAFSEAISQAVDSALGIVAGEAPPARAASTRKYSPRKATRARNSSISKWTADVRARRVPNFVIEATGLKTKKQIVKKYGEATFTKGKALPKALKG